MSNCKEIFQDIYARKVWGDGSGGGSGEQALPYCHFISGWIAATLPGKVLDIGSGDGVVARNIQWGEAEYIGLDVVDGFDALTDDLPKADLFLCKEVLQHLSNEQVKTLVDRTSGYKVRLFTSMTGEKTNEDIPTGSSRPVDLSLPPFNYQCRTVFRYGNGATWIVQQVL